MSLILVVDDTLSVVEDLMWELEEIFGHTVHYSTNGLIALNKLDEITPDVVICDVNMPQMDGIEFAETAVQQGKISKEKIFFYTANSGEHERAGKLGYISYMKPTPREKLIAQVDEIIGKTI